MSYREFYRRHLPHWQPPGATLFVTTRLVGSLPSHVITELKRERAFVANGRDKAMKERLFAGERAFRSWDLALDKYAASPKWLQKPEIAALVSEALHYRDRKVYDLLAYCIMPNHLHIVFTPLQQENGEYIALYKIMQSFKRHTAREANKKLGRQGAFWQAESYDHVVRNQGELKRILAYVIHNPVAAGLVSEWERWRWTYLAPALRPEFSNLASSQRGK